MATISSDPQALLRRLPPLAFALPNAFQGPSARTATESLAGRATLHDETLVAAGAVTTTVEKILQ